MVLTKEANWGPVANNRGDADEVGNGRYIPDFCKLLPSPSGRGAAGEGLVKLGNHGKPFSRLIALTIALFQGGRELVTTFAEVQLHSEGGTGSR